MWFDEARRLKIGEAFGEVVMRCGYTVWACFVGSNHVRYEGFESPLRLTTDVPLSYLQGQPFALSGP